MKFSTKNLTVLGLVLLAASAVTAAVLPNKPGSRFSQNGSCTQAATADPAAGGEFSCTVTDGTGANCIITATTETTDDDDNSFTNEDDIARQTVNNTSSCQ